MGLSFSKPADRDPACFVVRTEEVEEPAPRITLSDNFGSETPLSNAFQAKLWHEALDWRYSI